MMKIRIQLLGIALALFAVSGFAPATLDGISLKRQPKEGQVIKMRLKAEFELAGIQATYEGVGESKITKVDSDGSFTEEDRQLSGKAKINDSELDVPNSGVHTTIFNPDGTLREIKGEGDASGAAVYRMTNLELFIDAGHPVNVGDAWNVDLKASPRGEVAAKAEFKVLGEEKVGAVDAVKVSAFIHETEGTDPASNTSTIWVSKADGSTIKKESKWVNAPFPGSPSPVNATVSETLVP